jgi:hypothetical protein
MEAVWAVADITMGGMTIINLPACVIFSKYAIGALDDYERQKRKGVNPKFTADRIGIPDELVMTWKSSDDAPKKKKLKHLKELGFDREVARLCGGELTNRILKKQLSLYEQSESENLA